MCSLGFTGRRPYSRVYGSVPCLLSFAPVTPGYRDRRRGWGSVEPEPVLLGTPGSESSIEQGDVDKNGGWGVGVRVR